MPLHVSVPGAKLLYPGLWIASIEPASLGLFSSPQSRVGAVSVVLLDLEPTQSMAGDSISFDPTTARVLNLGSSDEAVLVYAGRSFVGGIPPKGPHGVPQGKLIGDAEFVSRLTPQLKALGVALLEAVRRQFSGHLVFHPKSEKFVESPDNFWTVRIQPRDVSLRITVRGLPTSFAATKSIELKKDMTSYSSFKISRIDQLSEAFEVIRQAANH